jgi:hypothetical protein
MFLSARLSEVTRPRTLPGTSQATPAHSAGAGAWQGKETVAFQLVKVSAAGGGEDVVAGGRVAGRCDGGLHLVAQSKLVK